MVPGGELEHGVECDKRANFSNMEGGGGVHLKKMLKIEREKKGGENRRRTWGQRWTANWSVPKTADSGVELVENIWN